MKKVDAVLLDFDGTIANTLNITVQVLLDLSKEFGFAPITADEIRALGSRGALHKAGVSMVKLPFLVVKARKKMAEYMLDAKPFIGTDNFLKNLQKHKISVSILTSNSAENVKGFLDRENLSTFVDDLYAGSHLFGKHREIRKVIKAGNLIPNRILYVGDETRDIEACDKAHINIVAAAWGFHDKATLLKFKPTVQIANSWDDVSSYIGI